MSELRHDPVYGRQVLIAPERLLRPNAILCEPWPADDPAQCPLCRGHESLTPPATLQLPDLDSAWQVRVIPNLYPAVSATSGNGQQEVIVESPRHVAGFAQLTAAERQLVFTAYRSRFRAAAQNPDFHSAILFKNYGRLAGASQYHIHSQFVALTQPLDAIRAACANARTYHARHDRCLFCEQIAAERQLAIRTVAESEAYFAFCPAASRTAYETWILPKRHASRFEHLDDDRLGQFCEFTSLMLARLENTVQHVAYNYAIHSAPFDSTFDQHYHWHMVISPRISGIAGFELSTSVFINPVTPETAAEQLRGALTAFPDP